jgi:hypothetical protein
MGAGQASEHECEQLKERLKRALSQSSGLQQMAGHIPADSEEEYEEIKRRLDIESKQAELELEDFVKDVAAALLGRSITIGKKLPYPAKLTKKQKDALAEYSLDPDSDNYMGHNMAIELNLARCRCERDKRNINCAFHGR